jgi:hypothetical protein
MKSISDEDKLRVEERKRTLGKKGLKELKIKVENAIEENDVTLFKPSFKYWKCFLNLFICRTRTCQTTFTSVLKYHRLKVLSLKT